MGNLFADGVESEEREEEEVEEEEEEEVRPCSQSDRSFQKSCSGLIKVPVAPPPHCPLVEALLGAGLEPSAPAGGWTLSARL